MVGEVIHLDELWACTNCMYCMENCSSSIEHVPKIINMRQYKVLTEADFAPELQLAYRNMENNSNPWGVGSHLRADWAKELGVKTLAEDPMWNICSTWAAPDHLTTGVKRSPWPLPRSSGGGCQASASSVRKKLCGDFGHAGRNEYLYQTTRPDEYRRHERL